MNFFKINPVIKVLIAITIIWLGGSIMMTMLEETTEFNNLGNALWWTIVTMTTVGYGDMTPNTIFGRVLAVIIMLSGISLIAIITGTISSIFTSRRIMEDRGLEKITSNNHTILCGWNKNAHNIIENLTNEHKNIDIVLINQESEQEINNLLSKNIKYVKGDYALDTVLNNANILEAKNVIIITDDKSYTDDKTIIAALTMKNMNAKIKIIAHLSDENKKSYLKRANIDTIILKNDYEKHMISLQISNPGIPETIHTLMDVKKNNSLKSISIPTSFIGKEYSKLKAFLFKENNYLCIGIYLENDKLGFTDFLSSDSSGLDAFIEKKLEKSGHALDGNQKTSISLNPADNYIIKKNEGAIIIS
jgi:voltage-gated potassium channel